MDNKCSWITLLPEFIIGAEGDPDDGSANSDASGDNSSDDDGQDAGNEPDAGSDNTHDDADDPKVKGLKAALEAERANNKANLANAKELKRLQRVLADAELAKKDDAERLQIELDEARSRGTRLAEGLLKRDLNDAIKTAAKTLGFIDINDAIDGVDRASLVYEQDEDDPTAITIDEKSIARAVKDLSTRKPHFVRTGTDDGEPTGGQFGGKPKQRNQESEEDRLRRLYPQLR